MSRPEKPDAGARQWWEAWYPAYALMGAATEGMASMLLPLAAARTGGATHAGLVMSAMSLGWLSAPLWGALADRSRWHRALFAGGALVAAVALAGFRLVDERLAWLLLAVLLGASMASLNTVANLFVVEAHPKAEWDPREAWLQTFYTLGLVGGLLLSSPLSHAPLRLGLPVAALLTAVAVPAGWLTTHTPPRVAGVSGSGAAPVAGVRTAARGRPVTRLMAPLRTLTRVARTRFGLFLAVWTVFNLGSTAAYALYPLLMRHEFGVAPSVSAAGYGIATGLSLLFYPPSGRWAERFGAAPVLWIGLAVRLLGFLALVLLGLGARDGVGGPALVAFGVVTITYALLGTAGPLLTSALAPVEEGEAMGLFMMTGALGGLTGAALGGWAADRWGYGSASLIASVGVGVALALSLPLRPHGGGMKDEG